ncbi:unnamed protein product [Alopecurus aequalis]
MPPEPRFRRYDEEPPEYEGSTRHLDHTNQVNSMVYKMCQEDRAKIPINRVHGPLPENAFVVQARDYIPNASARVTTATSRGHLGTRGMARNPVQQSRGARTASAATSVHVHDQAAPGRGRGRKRPAQASTSVPVQDQADPARGRGRARRTGGYNKGPGSAHYMLFGDDRQQPQLPDLNAPTADVLPDLNLHEVPLSQNAPTADDF